MRHNTGFTFAEMLLVFALLAVLAAIAIPSTLEAQARSRVAHARAHLNHTIQAMQAYRVDWNTVPCDNNDNATPAWRRNNWYFSRENPGVTPDVVFLDPSGNQWMERFYTKAPFVPLTTPVSYLKTVPLDPFSSVVPLGYDTRENTKDWSIYYCALFSAGPDRTEGNWYRGSPGQGGRALFYDPSNGVISMGDLVRVIPVSDDQVFKREYPGVGTYY